MLVLTSYPCASKKNGVHNINGNVSSTATNSTIMELAVFNFCFNYTASMLPFLPSNLITAPI